MLDRLTTAERGALVAYRDEMHPTHTLESVAHYLIRDSLIGLGKLPLPSANRSQGAKRSYRT